MSSSSVRFTLGAPRLAFAPHLRFLRPVRAGGATLGLNRSSHFPMPYAIG